MLGSLEQGCASKQEAERYVVKMDHGAQARIESLIHEAHCNSYTLYILVHDHAHWDIHKYVFPPVPVVFFNVQSQPTKCDRSLRFVCSASCRSSDSGLGLVDQLLNSRLIRDAPNILILHVTSFPFALQTQCTRISPYNEIHWPSAFSNVRHKS